MYLPEVTIHILDVTGFIGYPSGGVWEWSLMPEQLGALETVILLSTIDHE